MIFKVVFITFCLVCLVLGPASGAPQPRRKDQDLQKSFIEFLEQDKQLAPLLQSAGLNPAALSRQVRQAEEGNDAADDLDGDKNENKNGFFDRAAKFVMEVLQRFLKWVNTED